MLTASPGGPRLLKNVHPFAIPPGNPPPRCLTRDLLAPPVHEWVPERGAADGEANEPRYRRRLGQPFAYLFVILAATQDDAANPVPAATPRCCHHFHTIFTAV